MTIATIDANGTQKHITDITSIKVVKFLLENKMTENVHIIANDTN